MSRQFDGSNTYASNHRTAAVEHRTAIEPAPVAGSIKALAQRVLTRGSTSNSASNHDRTDQFEGHRTEGGSVRTKVRTPDASSMAQGYSDRTDRTSNYTNFGTGYQHPDGRIDDGRPEPTPPAAEPWPADLNDMLRRVATAFEWTQADVATVRQWARRDQQGIDDAREFLQSECDKLDIRARAAGQGTA